MIDLAKMLIERQSGKYDPSDIEDRYETRLRAMLDAKIAGHVPATEVTAHVDDSNVIDLMAALKKSLGQPVAKATPAPAKSKPRTREPVRNQPGLKLPIKGGKAALEEEADVPQPSGHDLEAVAQTGVIVLPSPQQDAAAILLQANDAVDVIVRGAHA